MIYIHKEEQELKSEKFVPHIPTKKLIELNSYIIYRVYIKKQKQVIKVKNLYIFRDIEIKKKFCFYLTRTNQDNNNKNSEVVLPTSTPDASIII